jgi:hypothetical protein
VRIRSRIATAAARSGIEVHDRVGSRHQHGRHTADDRIGGRDRVDDVRAFPLTSASTVVPR